MAFYDPNAPFGWTGAGGVNDPNALPMANLSLQQAPQPSSNPYAYAQTPQQPNMGVGAADPASVGYAQAPPSTSGYYGYNSGNSNNSIYPAAMSSGGYNANAGYGYGNAVAPPAANPYGMGVANVPYTPAPQPNPAVAYPAATAGYNYTVNPAAG